VKPIIIICGANHSGTSAVAEFLINHGAYAGLTDGQTCDSERPYQTYENIKFKRWCQTKIGSTLEPEFPVTDRELQNYMGLRLPENRTIVLKYPKSFACLHLLPDFGRPVKVLCVLRSIPTLRRSYVVKRLNPEMGISHQGLAHFATVDSGLESMFVIIEKMDDRWYCRSVLEMCNLDNRVQGVVDLSRFTQPFSKWKFGQIEKPVR